MDTAFDTSLQRRPLGCPVPLTGAQQNAWKRRSLPRHRSTRQAATAVRVLGTLDDRLLEECLNAALRRHESLRTRIVTTNGIPFQHVCDHSPCELSLIDLSKHSSEHSDESLRQHANVLIQEECDLSSQPPIKAGLLRLSRSEHIFVIATDHLLSDATSMRILSNEIWQAYRQGVQGLPLERAELEIQFPDYAVWQQQTYPSWQVRHEAHWKERLAGAPEVQTPIGHCLEQATDRTNALTKVPFGASLTNRLLSVARHAGIPLSQTVLGAYVCTLSWWCDQRDLVMGFVTDGRRFHPALATMVGCLAHLLPLRLRLRPADTFLDLLVQIRAELAAAFRHYDFGRASAFAPAMEHALQFNWLPIRLLEPLDRQRNIDDAPRLEKFEWGTARVSKLHIFFYNTQDGVEARIAYRPELYSAATVERLGRRLHRFAVAIAEDPGAGWLSETPSAR